MTGTRSKALMSALRREAWAMRFELLGVAVAFLILLPEAGVVTASEGCAVALLIVVAMRWLHR